jgi:hypothetical protein
MHGRAALRITLLHLRQKKPHCTVVRSMLFHSDDDISLFVS